MSEGASAASALAAMESSNSPAHRAVAGRRDRIGKDRVLVMHRRPSNGFTDMVASFPYAW
jgi:hypothetical protein